MDIGSVKPVLTGVTSPVPKTPTEQNQSTATDLSAEKTVKVTEKADSNNVDTSTDKSKRQTAERSTTGAMTDANKVKASSLDQTTGFDVFITDENKASSDTTDSPGNAAVLQDSQEFAMRMQAMINAWEGTGGSSRNSTYDQQV